MDAIFSKKFLGVKNYNKICGGGGKENGKNGVTVYQGFLKDFMKTTKT